MDNIKQFEPKVTFKLMDSYGKVKIQFSESIMIPSEVSL